MVFYRILLILSKLLLTASEVIFDHGCIQQNDDKAYSFLCQIETMEGQYTCPRKQNVLQAVFVQRLFCSLKLNAAKALPAWSLSSLLIKSILTKLDWWLGRCCLQHSAVACGLGAEILCQSVWKAVCSWGSRPLMKAVVACVSLRSWLPG